MANIKVLRYQRSGTDTVGLSEMRAGETIAITDIEEHGIDSLNDVVITTATSNDVLSFNGTNWVNQSTVDLTKVTADSLQLDTASTPTPAVGQIQWNDAEGTAEVLLKGGNVTLQLGQENLVRIHNNIGSTLVDGQVVYITGATGERPTVALASASSEAASSNTIGIVTESIAHGSEGFITTNGLVHGLNTNAYNEGDALWLSETAGTWSTTRPVAPNHGVFIGWIVKKSAGNGSIFVNIQNGYELNELHDVYIDTGTLAADDVIKWNPFNNRWENGTVATTTTLNDLTDVVLTAPALGNVLMFDGSSWVESDPLALSGLDNLTDVIITTPSTDQVLKYNGTNWVNAAPSGGSGAGETFNPFLLAGM